MTLRRTTLLLTSLVLALCTGLACKATRTAVFGCLPISCGSLATADIPSGALGQWELVHGGDLNTRLLIEPFRTSDDDAIVSITALLVWTTPGRDHHIEQAHSFDGRNVLVEQRTGEELSSPRRFQRLVLHGLDGEQGEELVIAPIRHEVLMARSIPGMVLEVDSGDGPAFVYRDMEGMAELMTELLKDPSAWEDGQRYRRAQP